MQHNTFWVRDSETTGHWECSCGWAGGYGPSSGNDAYGTARRRQHETGPEDGSGPTREYPRG